MDFIHIPKNCGHSFLNLIESGELCGFTYRDHWFDPKSLDPETCMFVLRDPVDRFVSAFYYSKRYKERELTLRTDIKTPSDLVKVLMSDPVVGERLLADDKHNIGGVKTVVSFIWALQSLWDNGAKYVPFFDRIQEDLDAFCDVTGRPRVVMPVANRSFGKDKRLEGEEIEYIRDRYRDDYDLISRNMGQTWKK